MRARSLLRTCPGISHAALSALIACAPQAAYAQAFQGSATTTFGTVTIDDTTAGVHNITVDTPRATITWTPTDTGIGGGPIDFLPIGNVVNYAANPALNSDYIVLNRIMPADTTRSVALSGLVNSDAPGSIWFYSPGGLLIGGSAIFNVGSLLLSTSDPVVDGSGDFMPVAGQFSVAGTSGSTSAIEIQAGAQLRAEAVGQSSYIVAVAPRIQQDGLISVRGSAALVAAESVDFALDGHGLFNISVTQGTEVSSNTFTHTGATGGPDAGGVDGDKQRVYMVAVPKNNAITMAIQSGGQIGFDVAGAADLDGNTIVLSAGYNVADSGIGNPIVAAPSGIGPADLSVARGAYTSNTFAAATSNAVVEDNAVGGIPDITFGSNLSVRANATAAVRANQGLVTVDGDLSIDASNAPLAGPAFGGNAQLMANGGNVIVSGNAQLLANATAGSVASGLGDSAFGGSLTVSATSGSSIAINGTSLIMQAVATGGTSGDTIGDIGGSGFGQNASLTTGGPADSITVQGGINIDVTGIGAAAGNSGGRGGNGTGGSVLVQANGGTIAAMSFGLTAVANGAGGHAGAGGLGYGGSVSFIADGGAILTTGNNGITGMASGYGGDANSTLDNAGSGTGGSVLLETRGAGGTVETNIGGGAGTGIALTAMAIGGRANFSGVDGGSAFGGTVNMATTGAGQSIISHSTGNSLLEATAIGNDSITSAGGNAFGGQAVLKMQGGTAQFDAGLLEIRADGTGGAGQINFAGNGSSGLAQIDLSGGASLSVAGNLAVVSLARGISGVAGGGAFGNRASIRVFGSSLTVGGTADVLADAAAGDSSFGPGGDAIGGTAELIAEAGSNIAITGDVQFTADALGGDGTGDFGGKAQGGDILVRSADSQVRLATGGGFSDFVTQSSPGFGSPAGQLIPGGAYVKTDNNGYVAMGGAGSGTSGNVEVLGVVTGGAGIDLAVSAAGSVVFNGSITDADIASHVSLRADNKGTGTGTVSGSGSINLNSAGSTVDIYHNPSSLGSPSDYSGMVSNAKLTTYQLIRDVMQLQSINGFLGQNFALSRDIDAAATAGWNAGEGFVPLGTGSSYSGNFDGLGNTISNLTINRPGATGPTGLFALVGAGAFQPDIVIRNVGLIDAEITGASTTGGLIGQTSNCGFCGAVRVSDAFVTGMVIGQNNVGGLIGNSNINTFVSGSYSSAAVIGSGNKIGGLIGGAYHAVVDRSFATGNVTAGNNSIDVGGLIGWHDYGSLADVYATGAVTAGSGAQFVGGLTGTNWVSVTRAYALGDVTAGAGSDSVGGLVGQNIGPGYGTISMSYSTGLVSASGSTNVGGFVGNNSGGVISNSYWDSHTSGQGSGFGADTGSISLLGAVTSDPLQSGAANYAFNEGAYASFTPGEWLYFRDASRPVGAWEAPVRRAGFTAIRSAHQMQMVDLDLFGAYRLAHDIDMSETGRLAGVWGDAGLFAVGDFRQSFSGIFEGRGHVLANLSINRPGGDLGLFGRNAGTIRQLGLANVSINGGTGFVGALAGHNNGLIDQTFAVGTVNGTGSSTGGLVGFNSNLGTVQQSHASVLVIGANTAGGLVGVNAGTVGFSFANGAVSAPTAGGLIGSNAPLAPIINSYWDTQLSGMSQMCGSDGGTNCTNANGLTTAQSRQAASFSGWQIDTTGNNPMPWRIYDGLSTPLLRVFLRAVPVAPVNFVTTYDTTVPNVPVVPVGYDPAHIFGTAMLTGGGSDVGTYSLSYAGGLYSDQLGYNLVDTGQTGTLTINPAALTVTADAAARYYGDANPAFTYTAAGLLGSDTLTGALASAATVTSVVGSYAITQGTLANGNYAITYVGDNLAVNQRPISVTADALARDYGDANPALTYTVGGLGLVNGDVLSGALNTLAVATSSVGSYAITQGTLGDSNYAITYTGANLGVLARSLTITADALSRPYGDANPALTYSLGGAGLVNGDTLTGSLATAATVTSGVGLYAITQGSLAASANYAVTYTGDNLTIIQRALAVAADPSSRNYGDGDPLLTYSAPGLVNGDVLTGALSSGTSVATGIGTYAIGLGTLDNPNYAITYTLANLTILARPIVVTADTLGRDYGQANPALTYSVGGAGLVNGDTLSGTLATSALAGSNVGAYAITQGSLVASPNYAMTFAPGVLNVNPAALGIFADPASRNYGDANPVLTYTTTGLFGGDTLTGALASGATVSSGIGNYAIGLGTLSASANYAITFNGANLTVNPRPLTISADALSRAFEDPNPALTYTLGGSGLVNGDVLTGNLTTIAGSLSPAGRYAITQGSLAASANYAVTYSGADLTVLPCVTGCSQVDYAPQIVSQVSSSVQQQSSESSESEEEQEATEEQAEEAVSEATQDPDVVISSVIDTSGVNQSLPVNESVTGAGNSTLWISGDQK